MKKQYIAPDLTAVVFRAERGYAASADNTVDAVAQQLNRWKDLTDQQIMGEVDDQNLWAASQDVAGIGNETDGLQAGYFGNGSTEGWF